MKKTTDNNQSKGGARPQGVSATQSSIDYLIAQGMSFRISYSRYDR